jgi:hypothetical protein
MSKRSTLPRWGQWAAGITLMLVALTAGALSLAVNVTYGLGAGLALAVAYGLSDVAKLTLPIVASGIGWSRHMRIVAIVAAAVSVWCAANYFADTEGQRLLEASHQTGQVEAAKNERARLQDELAALGTAGDPAILQKRVADLDQAVKDEAAAGGCGTKCRGLQRDRDEALAKLAQAKRKAELESQLADVKSAISESEPVETSGLAALAVAYTGGDKRVWSRTVVTVRALAALILMELLAHLAGAAARLIGQAMKPRRKKKAKPAKAKQIAHQPVALPQSRIGLMPSDRGRRGLASLAGVTL